MHSSTFSCQCLLKPSLVYGTAVEKYEALTELHLKFDLSLNCCLSADNSGMGPVGLAKSDTQPQAVAMGRQMHVLGIVDLWRA